MNSDEEYTAIQRAEVLNELRAYLDKSHAPGAYKMMVDALEADANRLAALTRPPSDEEVGKVEAVLFAASSHLREAGKKAAAAAVESVLPEFRRLSHQLSEAREKALEEAAQLFDDDAKLVITNHMFTSNDAERAKINACRIRALKSSDETKKPGTSG